MLRSRPCQPADAAAIETLRSSGIQFEPPTGPLDRLYEADGRIVAASGARFAEIAAPTYAPEPIPAIDEPFVVGEHRALIGTGLLFASPIGDVLMTQVHRLARTLASQEHGARYAIVIATVPELLPFDIGGAVQQICSGGIDAPAITLPLAEGYWPIGTITDRVVMIRRNDAF